MRGIVVDDRVWFRKIDVTMDRRDGMRIALAQIDTTVGDFEGNVAKVLEALDRAREGGAEVVVFPELTLCGYPPLDLLERRSFLAANQAALGRVIRETRGLAAVVGLATEAPAGRIQPARNSVAFVADGRLLALGHKTLLPTYDVFDEERYFVPADTECLVTYRGTTFGLTICEDLWNDRTYWPMRRYPLDPVERLVDRGAEVVLNLAASPFHSGKARLREEMASVTARRHGKPVLMCNLVGGNDELIFDGSSVGISPEGKVLCRARAFAQDLVWADVAPTRGVFLEGRVEPPSTHEPADVLAALELGLRDYVHKCGFRDVLIGLSGGIDSAVTAAISARALGPDHVLTVALPSRYSSRSSLEDAAALARNLKIQHRTISIEPLFQSALDLLQPLFGDRPHDVTEENLQARFRGVILMALSNKFGHLLLTTGNKSEYAVGYATLYGDMCGGLGVIADLPKGLVYQVAREINRQAGQAVIPESILTKAPSAELRPDQKDQDSLPPYDVLDGILQAYVEEALPMREIVARGYDPNTVRKVLRLIERSEYKRRQAAPGLRVTTKAFGMGRRIPLANRFSDAESLDPEPSRTP